MMYYTPNPPKVLENASCCAPNNGSRSRERSTGSTTHDLFLPPVFYLYFCTSQKTVRLSRATIEILVTIDLDLHLHRVANGWFGFALRPRHHEQDGAHRVWAGKLCGLPVFVRIKLHSGAPKWVASSSLGSKQKGTTTSG
eukprot:9488920-Pyramimonas_sp.AAC.2